jgi:hypothetical protein
MNFKIVLPNFQKKFNHSNINLTINQAIPLIRDHKRMDILQYIQQNMIEHYKNQHPSHTILPIQEVDLPMKVSYNV